QRTLESRTFFATSLVFRENRDVFHDGRMAQEAQYGNHEQIAGGALTLEIVAAVERRGDRMQASECILLRRGTTLLCPVLVREEEVDGREVLHVRLHGIERRKHPGERARSLRGIPGEE